MFAMKVEQQMDFEDRTLLLGKPNFDKIPKKVTVNGVVVNVVGISSGIAPPFLSLEVHRLFTRVSGAEVSDFMTMPLET